MDKWFVFLLIVGATATCTATISKSELFKPLRGFGPGWWRFLLGCPWCLNHWFAFIFTYIGVCSGITVTFGELLLMPLAVISFATIVSGLLIKLLLLHEGEKAILKQMLKEANERNKK